MEPEKTFFSECFDQPNSYLVSERVDISCFVLLQSVKNSLFFKKIILRFILRYSTNLNDSIQSSALHSISVTSNYLKQNQKTENYKCSAFLLVVKQTK